jgi:hypothetical protein
MGDNRNFTINWELANGSAKKKQSSKPQKNDLVLKHFDEFYFYARLLFKINILKNKIKRMKPLEGQTLLIYRRSIPSGIFKT